MPPDGTSLIWHAFHLPKQGHTPDEYEDAFAADASAGRFAVADGATESTFAGPWARLLAEGFVAEKAPWRDLDWVSPLGRRWSESVAGLPLPWYAEAKRDEGAYATLLGLAFRAGRPGQEVKGWRALAVGDSCLFHARGGRLLHSFPLTAASEFTNRPALIGSRRPPAVDLPEVRRVVGQWRTGDTFLLMTDALAHWFLCETESGQHPTAEIALLLAESAPQAAFAGWVEERRRRAGLRNDDVTLLVIDL